MLIRLPDNSLLNRILEYSDETSYILFFKFDLPWWTGSTEDRFVCRWTGRDGPVNTSKTETYEHIIAVLNSKSSTGQAMYKLYIYPPEKIN